ncbi:MAG: hypothetical protein ABUT20_44845 [Bacteroidota bacterium]
MMKTLSVSLFTFLFSITSYSQPGSTIDVQHYRFLIELSDATDSINCKAEIKIKFLAATDQFSLDLTSVSGSNGMKVTSVVEGDRVLETVHNNNRLLIKLPGNVNAGDSSIFTINYKGIPSDGLIISKNKFGHRTFLRTTGQTVVTTGFHAMMILRIRLLLNLSS